MMSRRVAMGVLMGLIVFCLVQPVHSQSARHHIGLGLGYFKAFSEELKMEELGVDFTSGLLGAVNYRFSVNAMIDLAVDYRFWTASQQYEYGAVPVTLSSSFYGGGVRLNTQGKTIRPYIQGNIYVAQEQVSAEAEGFELTAERESGLGFGIICGIDIRASNLISIPVEINFLMASPADNVTGLGFGAGINLSFGSVKPVKETEE